MNERSDAATYCELNYQVIEDGIHDLAAFRRLTIVVLR